jgi:hypothetical protein
MTSTPRTRTYSWDDPVPPAAAGRQLAGIEYLRAVGEKRLPRPPIAATEAAARFSGLRSSQTVR